MTGTATSTDFQGSAVTMETLTVAGTGTIGAVASNDVAAVNVTSLDVSGLNVGDNANTVTTGLMNVDGDALSRGTLRVNGDLSTNETTINPVVYDPATGAASTGATNLSNTVKSGIVQDGDLVYKPVCPATMQARITLTSSSIIPNLSAPPNFVPKNIQGFDVSATDAGDHWDIGLKVADDTAASSANSFNATANSTAVASVWCQ